MQHLTLTQDQEKAKEALLSFLGSEEKYFTLKGAAGTGKTALITHVHQAYVDTIPLRKIVTPKNIFSTWHFTATTNKAAEALEHALSLGQTQTIHSLLSLYVRQDYSTGETSIYRRKDAEPVEDAVIIIDEASYIDGTLLSYIQKCTPKSKVIFMGDPNQLTPVGSEDTPVFNRNFMQATLTEVVRQTKENPIQTVCIELRKTIEHSVGFPKITLCPEIQQLSKEDFEQAIKDEFTRSDWTQGDSKVLAWTNKAVQKYNTLLFKYCNQRSQFKQGDYVINNHYVKGLKVDAEYSIEYFKPTTEQGISGHIVELTGSNDTYFLPGKSKHYEKAKKAALETQNVQAVREISDSWVDLRPAYACTINKSQGSTYGKVFIDLGDLAKCRDALQKARLLYVGMSRAKFQVIFTGDL